MTSPKRIIVIGALSTMAIHVCRKLAEGGASFALLARQEERLEETAQDLRVRGAANVATRALDLALTPDPAEELAQIANAIGGADVVLIFYGYLGDQAKAETDLEEAARIMSVNFSSASLWALAATDFLIKQGRRGASLIGISSVAGDRGRRSNYVYGAAKGGFSILMQGIAHKLAAHPSGVRAKVIKFGFVDTAMTASITKGGPLWASADAAADCVVRAIDRGGPIIYAPWFWRWIMLIIRCLPAPIFNRVNL